MAKFFQTVILGLTLLLLAFEAVHTSPLPQNTIIISKTDSSTHYDCPTKFDVDHVELVVPSVRPHIVSMAAGDIIPTVIPHLLPPSIKHTQKSADDCSSQSILGASTVIQPTQIAQPIARSTPLSSVVIASEQRVQALPTPVLHSIRPPSTPTAGQMPKKVINLGPPTPTPWIRTIRGYTLTSDCPCNQGNTLNCSSFSNGQELQAQACFEKCMEFAGRDVHRLDGDGDGTACEWQW